MADVMKDDLNAPAPAGHPFQRTLEGLGGNLALLKKLAPSVAEHYARTAQEFRELGERPDLGRLEWLAHKLNGTWGLYSTADDGLDLPGRIEEAAQAGDVQLAATLALDLAQRVERTAADLRTLVGGA